jgi:hypothetical protein
MRNSTRRRLLAAFSLYAVAALAACNSGSGGNIPAGGPNSMPGVVSSQSSALAFQPARLRRLSPITTYPGAVVGTPDKFTPNQGDTAAGGHGETLDNLPCDPKEYLDDYHVHVYVGVIVNGEHLALPIAIGMKDPRKPMNGYISKTKCYYFIHTHDSSGIVHIEDPRNLAPSSVVYHLHDVLKVWGVKFSKQSFATFKGPVHVFVGQPPRLGATVVNSYTAVTRPLGEIPVRSHEVIWIEIGNSYYSAKQLPPVTFYMEY